MRSTRIAKFLVRESVRVDPCNIKATFDAPVQEYQEPVSSPSFYKVYFEIGPFKYILTIRRSPSEPGRFRPLQFRVEFFLKDIQVPEGETLAQALSRFTGEDMSEDEAYDLHDRMVGDPYGVYNLKNLNFRVLSAVIQSVKSYFSHEEYECILFSAHEKSRMDLYRRMITKLFPDHRFTEENVYGTSVFKVCKPEGVS